MNTRQDSHHLPPTSAHHDVTAHCIQNINGFSLSAGHQRQYLNLKTNLSPQKVLIKIFSPIRKPGLPRASSERIWFRGQGPHWAYINNIPREFGHEHLLNISADLQVIASAGGTQVLHACNLTGKAVGKKKKKLYFYSVTQQLNLLKALMPDSPHTASALDTTSHYGFDERANVFVLHSSFALCETTPVTTKLHGLVLQTKFDLV